ncbi:MAG: UvrD-helicase domain-containing protein [Phycisphaeraceae bacterium JB051]
MSTLPDLPHLIIRASAGTGKTYQLTQQYLKMVHDAAPPQSILATTFTRKAANEILERVIETAAENALENKAKIPFLKSLTTNLHRLMISTLDSLFQKMGRCFAMELQLPSNAQIFESNDFAMLKLQQQAIEQVLTANEPFVLLDLMRRLYHSNAAGGGKVVSILQSIVSDLYDVYKLAPDEAQWTHYDTHGMLDDDGLKQLAQIHASLEDELPKKKDGSPQVVASKAWLKDQVLIEENNWRDFIKNGIAKARCEGKEIFNRAQLSEPVIRTYDLLIQHARGALLDEQKQLNLARYTVAKQYAQVFDQLRLDARALMHSDIPQRLEQAFSDPDAAFISDLAYRMDQKIDHMMLDEFQDTSLQQWNILREQALEICSHVDQYASRRFFCVGDIKQAIYGWRGGCAEIFNHIGQDLNLPDAAMVSMDLSYRSSQIVLDTVNLTFNQLSQNAGLGSDELVEWSDDWQKGFADHKAARDLPGYVHFQVTGNVDSDSDDHPMDTEDDPSMDDHTIEVCNHIADLHHKAPHQTIGVLVWKNADVQKYMTRLRTLHIDVASEGGVYLHDDPAVSCILAALYMADRPDNSAAAFEVLNSPLGQYLGMTGYTRTDVNPIAWQIRVQLAGLGYPRLIGQWANWLSEHADARGSERLTLLVQLATNFEASQSASLKPSDFSSYVRAKQVPISQQSPVQVMTVHKSKGLEFDAVILPVLSKQLGYMHQSTCFLTRPTPTDPVAFVYASGYKELRQTYAPLVQAHAQEWQRRFSDDLCGLYVAMTRAKHAMYLFAQPLQLNKKGDKLKTAGYTDSSAAAILRHALLSPDQIEPDAGRVLYTHGDPDWHQANQRPPAQKTLKNKANLHKTATIKLKSTTGKRSLQRIAPSQLEGGGSVNVADLLALTKSSGQSRGTVIHRLFEEVDWLSAGMTLPDRQQLIDMLDDEGLEHEPEFTESFMGMLQMPAVIDALTRPADWDDNQCQLWQEKSFAVVMDGRLVQGQLDRVHIWPDRALILDYKTDTPPPEAPEKSGYDALVDHYRPQIQAYRKALAAMRKLPMTKVKAKLIFVRDGVVKDV